MRCLTLAQALRDAGHESVFVSRLLDGHLCDYVESQGFTVIRLPRPDAAESTQDWLGLPWELDAQQTIGALDRLPETVAWVVVDHYGLDSRWERMVRPKVGHIFVIDDLADRPHDCDLLLDQNLSKRAEDYRGLIRTDSKTLFGPHYALLRREFSEWRESSLTHKDAAQSGLSVYISMGGVDHSNATGKILHALSSLSLPVETKLMVIMGGSSPWINSIREQAAGMPWSCSVVQQVSNMAEHMATCNLMIGAGGSTSWERCCLGVPTILVVLAGNQRPIAEALARSGAAVLLGEEHEIPVRLPTLMAELVDPSTRSRMSQVARTLCDGQGVSRVLSSLSIASPAVSYKQEGPDDPTRA